MAERTVSVRINLKADGLTNIGLTSAQIAKNMGAAFTAANKLKDVTASRSMIAGMSAASAAAGLNPVAKQQAREAAEIQAKALKESLAKLTVGAGAAAAAGTGFVAAASPAAYQTLTGSLKLAAGEIGLLLIPAVVEVSKFFQELARTLRTVNDAVGGFIGRFLKAAAIPTALILLGAAVFSAVKWVYTMASAASAASMSLGLLARAGGVHWMAAGMGGAPVAATSGSRLGAGIGGGVALGSALLGAAIGGNAGGTIANVGGMAGTGAMIGASFGPLGAVIGGLGGAIVGAITAGFTQSSKLATSFNFQAGGGNLEDIHDMLQREALRDPMQQAQAEQQARALQELAQEIHLLATSIGNGNPVNQGWQVNQ